MVVKKFKELSKEDVLIAGGKGASLGEMFSSGIPVPAGFVILSNAFQDFISKTGLISEIEGELNKVNIDNVETIETASENIQSMIYLKKFPKEFEEKIHSEFDLLDSKFVAVRSSATSEDSADAAWAGQLDTFLNTTNKDLIENVKKCWASLFTPRAIFYRFEKGLDKIDVSVAVVVQKMVQSEISGIAFSVHPVTEDRNQILIEAGFGLGEAIVSGSVTPDNYVVNKKEMKIENKGINSQTRALYKGRSSGVEWKNISSEKAGKQKFNDNLILKLSDIIVKIENHYGFPCDIEWAYEKEELYITQSRPITTLCGDVMVENKKEDLADKFLKLVNGKEIFQCMDVNVFPETVVWTERQFIKEFYEDKNPLPFLILMEGEKSVAYYQEEKFDTLGEEFTKKYFEEDKSAKKAVDIFKSNIKEMDGLYEKYSYEYMKKLKLNDLQKIMPRLMWLMESKFFSEMDKQKCKKYLKGMSEKEIDEVWKHGSEPTFESFDSRQKRLAYAEIVKGNPLSSLGEQFQYFYTGLTRVLNLEDTKKALEKDYKIDLKEAKKILIGDKKEDEDKKKKFDNWYNQLNSNQKFVVAYLQEMIELKDLRKDMHLKGITIFYRIVALKIFDVLKIPEEYIQFVSYTELLNPLEYFEKNKKKIMDRKKGYGLLVKDSGKEISQPIEFESSKKKLDDYLDKDKKLSEKLIGEPTSRGKVVGKVKIITSVKEQSKYFEKGEILVTGMTRPEYMPLVKKAVAIVTDEGGIACHAAIVARELYKPCVTGVGNGTRVLKDGDLVEVDADVGIVKILERKK